MLPTPNGPYYLSPAESISHGPGLCFTRPNTDNPHESSPDSTRLGVGSWPSGHDSANQEEAQEQKEQESSKKEEMRRTINEQSGILALLLRLGIALADNSLKSSENTTLSARYEPAL